MLQPGQNKKTGGSLSRKTVLEFHRLLSTIFTQAKKLHIISRNPAGDATPPPPPKPRRPTTSPPSLQKSKLPLMRNPPSDGRSATCAWSTVTTAASSRASSAPASTSTLTLSCYSAWCCTIPGAALMRSLTQRTKKTAYSRCLSRSRSPAERVSSLARRGEREVGRPVD